MAYASVANIDIAGGSGGGTSSAIDTTGANLIVIVTAQFSGGTLTTPTDSKGNTYTGLTARTNGSVRNRIFYCLAPTVGSGHTFTFANSGIFASASVQSFSGAATSSVFDVENGATGSLTTLATGSVTPGQDDSLVIAGVGSGNTGSASINGGFTIANQTTASGSRYSSAGAYLIQTTATAANPTWTTGDLTGESTATIAVFKPAGGGGAFVPIIGRGPGMALAGRSGLVGRQRRVVRESWVRSPGGVLINKHSGRLNHELSR